jgi:hypothetical protein
LSRQGLKWQGGKEWVGGGKEWEIGRERGVRRGKRKEGKGVEQRRKEERRRKEDVKIDG